MTKGFFIENFVAAELISALNTQIYSWNERNSEIEFLIVNDGRIVPIEVKSGETLVSDSFKGLKYYHKLAGDKSERPVLIYGGNENYIRNDIQVLSWQSL